MIIYNKLLIIIINLQKGPDKKMKKIIFNIDKFIIIYFNKITDLLKSNNRLISFIGFILLIISTIIFLIPILLLELVYKYFIDRDELKKLYQKGSV